MILPMFLLLFRMEKKRERRQRRHFWDCNSRYHRTYYRMSNINSLILSLCVLKVHVAEFYLYIGCQYVLSPSQHAYELLIWCTNTNLILYSLFISSVFWSKIRNDNILELLLLFPCQKMCFFFTNSLCPIHSIELRQWVWHNIIIGMSLYECVCVR